MFDVIGLILSDEKTIQSYYVNVEIVIDVILIKFEKDDEKRNATSNLTNESKEHKQPTSSKQANSNE